VHHEQRACTPLAHRRRHRGPPERAGVHQPRGGAQPSRFCASSRS